MENIEWEKLIQIDRSWVSRQLEKHFNDINGKINITLYTVKVSGTQISPESLAEELHCMLPHYVYGKKEISELTPLKAGLKANQFFGKKNPQTDGKYGELLLFALTEGMLNCKMVAHKIRTLTNHRDQVKGGDGIFLGNYLISDGRVVPAYFIGESKVTEDYSVALDESLKSVNRFCDTENSPEFTSTELLVAKENLMLDDSINIDELYNRLTPTSTEFREQILVLPILLMFNSDRLKNCENAGHLTPLDLENAIRASLEKKKINIIALINKKLENYEHVKKVHLHFFILPFNNIDSFRNTLYYKIHGIPYSA